MANIEDAKQLARTAITREGLPAARGLVMAVREARQCRTTCAKGLEVLWGSKVKEICKEVLRTSTDHAERSEAGRILKCI